MAAKSNYHKNNLYIFDYESSNDDDQITDQEDNDEASDQLPNNSESETNDEPPALPLVKSNSSTNTTISATTSTSANYNVHCGQSHLADDRNNVNDLSDSSLVADSNQLVLQELKKITETLDTVQRRLTSTEDNVKSIQTEIGVLNKKKLKHPLRVLKQQKKSGLVSVVVIAKCSYVASYNYTNR